MLCSDRAAASTERRGVMGSIKDAYSGSNLGSQTGYNKFLFVVSLSPSSKMLE
jgi:hypothetical protein